MELMGWLGYYLGTWGYAYLELLGNAITGAKSLNDDQIASYLRDRTIKTIMGDIKFGAKGMDTQTVLTPADLKTGNIIYPYEKAK